MSNKIVKVAVVTHENFAGEECVGYEHKTMRVLIPEADEKTDNKELQIEDYERLFAHSFIMDTMRKLMGKTLTIIDASVANKVQNKAVKDLVRQAYSEEMSFATEWGFDQDVMIPMAEANAPEEILVGGKAITVEQALGVDPLPKG